MSFAGVLLYSSCEKNPCNGVSCENGGSCNGGACYCPTGFEGPTCSFRSTSRFTGYYAGYSSCNNGALIIDTVFISNDVPHSNTMVKIVQKTHPNDLLYGTINTNQTTYAIFIPSVVDTNYSKSYNVTLQSSNSLILDTYELDKRTPGDSIVNKCRFTGTKH